MKIIKPQVFSPPTFSRASTATYINNLGFLATAGVDVLRIGYDPLTHAPIGPIIEPAGTNFLWPSNDFDDFGQWVNDGATINPAPSTASPTGGTETFYFSLTGTNPSIRRAGYVQTGVTQSLYVRRGSPGTVRVRLETYLFPNYIGASFVMPAAGPISTASVSAGITTYIEQLQDGWYRIAIKSTGESGQFKITRELGGFYLFGAQVEVSPTGSPTSYIPTTTVAVTRAADVITGTPPVVLSTNVAELDEPQWDPGIAYVAGNRVMVLGDYHRIYEAVANSTNKFPPDNIPDLWLDAGATNSWQMFDMASGTEKQTVSNSVDETIAVSLSVVGPVSSVVLLNVVGGEVLITVKDEANNVIGQQITTTLGLPRDTGWWDFFFGQRPDNNMFIFSDFNLPIGAPGTIQVTVEGGGSPARIGKLIVGEEVYIGCAKYGSSGGIIDFSRKQRDDFGNTTILERRYIDKFDYDIQIETMDAYSIKNFLASIRATPAVYIGSENHLVTVVFGFYRDFSIVLQGPEKSACSLQTEGI